MVPQNIFAEIFSEIPDQITITTYSESNFQIEIDYKESFDEPTVVKKNKNTVADIINLKKGEKGHIQYDGNTNFENVDTKMYLLNGKVKIVKDKENGGKKIKLDGDKISIFSGVNNNVSNFDIPKDIKNGKYQFIVIFTNDDNEINYYYITNALIKKNNNKDTKYYSDSQSFKENKTTKTITVDNDDNINQQNDELSLFNRIPSAIINSNNGTFEFGADFSLNFGDKTQIIHHDNAKSAYDMVLNVNDNELSLELNCDSDDLCGIDKAIENANLYLADISEQDEQIAKGQANLITLEKHKCETNEHITDCTNFSFSLPEDLEPREYKIVVELDFGEAEWWYINDVRIGFFILYISDNLSTFNIQTLELFDMKNNFVYDNGIYLESDEQNTNLAFPTHNFIAVGDYYCNKETEKTIQKISSINPEVVITTGDHVKKDKSAECWKKISEPLKDKMRIAIGNHDAEFSSIYKEIIEYHELGNPYYSHDFKNIHFISLSTEHPFGEGTKQYEFIKYDLEKTSKDKNINWIIIHQHKPLYSTNQDKNLAKELRQTYHKLFQEHDVDLVISSHNQYYERTYPLLYNEQEKKSETNNVKPIITNTNKYVYPPTDGIIFLTVGTAGDKLDKVKQNSDYHV
ncbi:MAG: metallophosphoesterase, partial [Nitrososphaeraceae archaeon]